MARDFNGTTSDYLNAGTSPYLDFSNGDMTVSLWFRKHNTGGGRPIGKWSPTTGQQFLMESIGLNVKFALYIGGVQVLDSNTNVLTLNVWHHIALTYDGSNMKIYVDGVEQGTRSQSGSIASRPNTDLLIAEGSLDGEIGHVALWDNGLSADDIESLASGINPLQISPDTLLEYFPINGQSPEPGIVHGCSAVVNGTTVVDEPPISNSIKAS